MDKEDETSRRNFLQLGAAAFVSGSALSACTDKEMPEPSAAQRELKRKGRSSVFLASVENYESVDSALELGFARLATKLKSKSVFLKPNLVDFREGLPVCTNPKFLDSLIKKLKEFGVGEIKVGDGPALSRDTMEIARLSGIAAVCKNNDIEFVDLNIDDLRKVENPLNFTGIKEFLLPRSICDTDLLISVPKLKTHHWALLTASMKNMFGVIPGRKYGWPKNILHVRGINPSICDVIASCKPGLAIVDGVEAMEGDGPLNGKSKELKILAIGEDLVAVDTVCGISMELPVHNIAYMKLAGMVLGNNDLSQIDVLGSTIEAVKMKCELPPTFDENGKPRNLSALEKGAESGVT